MRNLLFALSVGSGLNEVNTDLRQFIVVDICLQKLGQLTYVLGTVPLKWTELALYLNLRKS